MGKSLVYSKSNNVSAIKWHFKAVVLIYLPDFMNTIALLKLQEIEGFVIFSCKSCWPVTPFQFLT